MDRSLLRQYFFYFTTIRRFSATCPEEKHLLAQALQPKGRKGLFCALCGLFSLEFNDFSLLIRLYKARHLVFCMLFDTYCIPSNVSEK